MKAKMVAAVGLIAMSTVANAAPRGKGIEGPLGDELFYNYLEGFFGQTYFENDRNERVSSDTSWGIGGSVFIYDPVYFHAEYRYNDFSYFADPGVPPANATANSNVDRELERTQVGLGLRLPLAYSTDLFANANYELMDKKEIWQAVGSPTRIRYPVEYDGYGLEAGLRGFISGFAELQVKFRYTELESDKRLAVGPGAGRTEELKEKISELQLLIPVYDLLSLFARVNYGVTYSNINGIKDFETENYIIGARMNFRLPR